MATELKVDATGLGQRFGAEPVEGSVAFASGPLPRQPLHLLTRFGAWIGQQRRGFHGGAGLEEVAVPFAFLGRVLGQQEGRAKAPAWWWSSDDLGAPVLPVEAPRVTAASAPTVRPAAVAVDPRLAPLSTDELRVVELLKQNQAVRLTAVAAHLKKPAMRVAGLVQQLMRKMFELGCPWITVEVLPDNDRLYRYEEVDRGTR